jgi:uroporphyrinogen III methyltransferase / synthase
VSRDPETPLAGRRVLVTRAEEKGDRFGELLSQLGAQVVQVPLVRFEEPDSWRRFDAAVAQLGKFQRILFTSGTAVDRFFERLQGIRGSTRLPQGMRLMAVGPKTAQAVARWGQPAAEVAKAYRAEGILAILPGDEVKGQEILFPRAQEARELLVEELARRGAHVCVVPVYRTRPVEESRELLRNALQSSGIDLATFTSASAVRSCAELLGEKPFASLMRGVVVACLGEVTAQAARTAGLHPEIVPARSTLEELADAIAGHYRAACQESARSESPLA